MNSSIVPVILAGGKGERFWPLSRRARPKQFLCLDGSGRSLLQATADRLLDLAGGWENLWVITSAPIAEGAREQLPELPERNLLVEPEGRDTAPAVAWATLEVAQRHGEEAVVGFFPADPWIGDVAGFCHTIAAAAELAATERAIVTLGISPAYPSTGYGYIEQGNAIGNFGDLAAYQVSRFTEKPDAETAAQFIETGRYSWNSGIFVFRASTVLAELDRYAPGLLEPLRAQGKEAYSQLEKKSIDYALMEKTQLACVIPADFGWDDLGDWNALERLQGNVKNVENARHVGLETEGCIIHSSDGEEIIATIGLKDVVVVRDRNVTLVVPKNRTQDIKLLLKELQGNSELEELL